MLGINTNQFLGYGNWWVFMEIHRIYAPGHKVILGCNWIDLPLGEVQSRCSWSDPFIFYYRLWKTIKKEMLLFWLLMRQTDRFDRKRYVYNWHSKLIEMKMIITIFLIWNHDHSQCFWRTRVFEFLLANLRFLIHQSKL
jgi:hypothetical protein